MVADRGDPVGLPARLAAVARVAGVVLQLGAGGGCGPLAHPALALQTLLQEQPEVGAPPRATPFISPHYS